MISSGYKKVLWGVLISGLHINLDGDLFIPDYLGQFQILPSFIGYFIIFLGVKELFEECKLEYMEKLKKDAMRLIIASCALWIFGLFLPYYLEITKGLMALFYLLELLFYGDFLNKTIKYYKENNMEKYADKLRKSRMSFIKAFMALIILHLVGMIPVIAPYIEYATISLMFVIKIWFTLLIQKPTFRLDNKM